jgi:hypothetical protein
VVGSPDTVTARLRQLHDELGFGQLSALFAVGGITSEQMRRGMELFASEVMPSLRPLARQPPNGTLLEEGQRGAQRARPAPQRVRTGAQGMQRQHARLPAVRHGDAADRQPGQVGTLMTVTLGAAGITARATLRGIEPIPAGRSAAILM